MAGMTHSEAFTQIEKKLTGLELRDVWGDKIDGPELLGFLVREGGDLWEEAAEKLQAHKITPDEYAEICSGIVDRIGRWNVNKQVEKVLRRKS